MSEDILYINRETPAAAPKNTDYSVKVTGAMAEPYIHDGDTVFVSASTDLADGDIGIFLHSGRMVVRQYCEDSFGNIYLLTLNRERSENDLIVRASSGKMLVCFGRVLLKEEIPLPKN